MSKKKSKNKQKADPQKINENAEFQETAEKADTSKKKSEDKDKKSYKAEAEVKTEKTDNDTDKAEENAEAQSEPIPPRKRKIIKNNQLTVVLCITIAAVLTAVIWSMFFNRDITGTWYYYHTGTYTETKDIPSKETTDQPEIHTYTQRVSYNFDDDNICTVTLGSMSVKGPYQIYDTGAEPILAVGVYYLDTPLFIGNYNYKVSGNVFTGKKLTLYSSEGSASDLVLDKGEGEFSLKPFENAKLDEKIYGRWKNSEYDQYFTFKDDGHMILELENKIVIDHVYTIMGESTILTRYEADSEQNYSYYYNFDDEGSFYINGAKMIKVK